MLSRRSFAVALATRALILTVIAHAQDVPAGSSSSKAKHNSEQHVKASHAPTESDQGVYRNSDFGFAYHVPYGWVDRTKDMQPESSDPAKSRLLLAVSSWATRDVMRSTDLA